MKRIIALIDFVAKAINFLGFNYPDTRSRWSVVERICTVILIVAIFAFCVSVVIIPR